MWMESHLLAGLHSTLEPYTRARVNAQLTNPKIVAVTLHKIGSRMERVFGTALRIYHLTEQGWQRIAKRGALVALDEMDYRLLGITRGNNGQDEAGRGHSDSDHTHHVSGQRAHGDAP